MFLDYYVFSFYLWFSNFFKNLKAKNNINMIIWPFFNVYTKNCRSVSGNLYQNVQLELPKCF